MQHGFSSPVAFGLIAALAMMPACAEPAADPAAASPVEGYDQLLREHVDSTGLVDYQSLREQPQRLDAYAASLAQANLEAGSREERLARLINAYNAFTLQLIVEHPGVASIFDIPDGQRWDHARWSLGGEVVSLNQIEHELIRPVFDEPRIHFALVCAALDCPPLRAEAYTAQRLEEQLEAQTVFVHGSPKHARYDAESNTVKLTPLYDWYGEDFGRGDKLAAVTAYVRAYLPGVDRAVGEGRPPKVEWLDYDWALNVQPGRN